MFVKNQCRFRFEIRGSNVPVKCLLSCRIKIRILNTNLDPHVQKKYNFEKKPFKNNFKRRDFYIYIFF